MLTTLSILSRDQGSKWQEPKRDTKTPEVAPGRLHDLLRAIAPRLAALSRRPAPSRSRA
jgi:hypothetical protein